MEIFELADEIALRMAPVAYGKTTMDELARQSLDLALELRKARRRPIVFKNAVQETQIGWWQVERDGSCFLELDGPGMPRGGAMVGPFPDPEACIRRATELYQQRQAMLAGTPLPRADAGLS